MKHDRTAARRGNRMTAALVAAVIALSAVFLALEAASAQPAQPAAEDPAIERRMASVAEELRCLVCQNQTIADSNADLAVDLKQQIREQLRAGRTEKEIVDYMVQRYGDFVLYRPPLKSTTAALWFGPLVFGIVAVVVVVVLVRRRRRDDAPPGLSDADRLQAADLLAGRAGRDGEGAQ